MNASAPLPGAKPSRPKLIWAKRALTLMFFILVPAHRF